MVVAGTDGCRSGWVLVRNHLLSGAFELAIMPTFREVIAGDNLSIVAVDIPIGLHDSARQGGRTCDVQARRILGPQRASSVFSPPARPSLHASSYPEAVRLNRNSSPANIGISRQTYGLYPKLREVDEAMSPELQESVREVHPEVCFLEMNGGRPLPESKKSLEGHLLRLELIRKAGFSQIDEWVRLFPRAKVAPDDVLDACAACWTADRIRQGVAKRIPDSPEKDFRGLWMEIWA